MKSWFHWASALSLELILFCWTLGARAMRRFWETDWEKEVQDQKGIPILLIHGYLHDSSAWVYHRRQLIKRKIGPVFVLTLRPLFASIQEYAKLVAKKKKEIEKKTGSSQIHLVGHSMGGLVASWYATHIASEEEVASVVTVGSPLQGTRMALFGLGPNAKEMRRGSPFLQALGEAMRKKRSAIPFFHIGTKTDQLVLPYTCAFLDLEEESVKKRSLLLEGVGHIGLLFSKRVSTILGDRAWIHPEINEV